MYIFHTRLPEWALYDLDVKYILRQLYLYVLRDLHMFTWNPHDLNDLGIFHHVESVRSRSCTHVFLVGSA